MSPDSISEAAMTILVVWRLRYYQRCPSSRHIQAASFGAPRIIGVSLRSGEYIEYRSHGSHRRLASKEDFRLTQPLAGPGEDVTHAGQSNVSILLEVNVARHYFQPM